MFSGLKLLFLLFAVTTLATATVAIVSAPLRQKWLGVIPLGLWVSGDLLIGMNPVSDDADPAHLLAQALIITSSFAGVYLCWWGLKGGFRPQR
jgi:hypothetical protein